MYEKIFTAKSPYYFCSIKSKIDFYCEHILRLNQMDFFLYVLKIFVFLILCCLMKFLNTLLLLTLPVSIFADILKPYDLTVGENFDNPVGYCLRKLSFSWKLPQGDNIKQTAYRIQVVHNPEDFSLAETDLYRTSVWDTKKVESSQSINIPFYRELLSQERLYWRVKYWDNKGRESMWSDVKFFEAGLLDKSDFLGEWISSPFKPRKWQPTLRSGNKIVKKPAKTEVQPTYFRKEFELNRQVKKARMYVATLGVFQAYINGEKIGDDVWGTGWTNYNKRVQVNTYDITKLLEKGKNAVGALLGDGWYAGTIGWRHKGVYGDIPAIKIYLDIEFDDGSNLQLATDKSWKSSYGAIQYSDIYMGEKYDARLEMDGWNEVGFDDSNWKNASYKIKSKPEFEDARRNTMIRPMQYLKPVNIRKIGDKKFIVDMGQNMVGWAEIKMSAPKGEKIKLRYGEMLQQTGMLYTENYRFADSRDEIISNGKTFVWSPTFTFHGFRYIEISGIDYTPELDDIKGVVLHNDIAQTANFECSDEMINKLQSCILWGQKSNFFSVPTDCPQRDERLGWTGDATAFTPTASFNMDVRAFFHKWSLDMRDSQRSDGNMAFICPDILGAANGAPFWGDAIVVIPYEIYMAYGDKKILVDNYDAMKKWVDYQNNSSKEFIRANRGFGDWLQPNSNKTTGDTPNELIATAYFAYTAELVSKTAKILDKKDDIVKYQKLSDDVKKAFNKKFVKQDGEMTTDAQTAYLVPLNLNVIAPEMREKVFAKLVKRIENDNFHLRTGFIGTPHLNPTLSKFGRPDLAYRLLMNKTYPSWLYPITQGATTMWERWNSYTHKDGFGDVNMNSFNHYAYGAIGQWIYKDVAGLWYADAGYSKILYAPTPNSALNYASVWHDTPYGRASSKWNTIGGKEMRWQIQIPSNSEGIVVFKTKNKNSIKVNGKQPVGLQTSDCGYPCITLGSGEYQITYSLN